uniref:Immunoglobulin domain-containing protein n=1 Tax=Sinocyclocheilus grahami TaxID=75366 RepID=A0A672K6Q3_SINGR
MCIIALHFYYANSIIKLLVNSLGFSAEISVVVQTGNSVQLHIQTQELPEFDDLSWKNDKSEIIVRYTSETKRVRLHSSYKDRVDFNDTTFSLTLKNMQKTDSGLYTARASGDSDNNIVTYRVSVIDAVEAPVLIVNSNWSSPEPCYFTCNRSNITVSLVAAVLKKTSRSSDNHTLRLSCSGDSIICNPSEPVSWKTDTEKVNKLCTVNRINTGKADNFLSDLCISSKLILRIYVPFCFTFPEYF